MGMEKLKGCLERMEDPRRTDRGDIRHRLEDILIIGRWSHWPVEDQLHWCLDVIFHEDLARARKDLSPLDLNVLRKVALTLCRDTDLENASASRKNAFAPPRTPRPSVPSF